jgi:DMSO/TMAO reductase YedYZ heme-binding membrane subunit
MKTHPLLRAYMAGIVFPTVVLLFGVTAFTIARYVYHVPIPIERAIMFPLTVVPNLWGVWNMLYLAIGGERRWSIGVHGAVLPLILIPLGVLLARLFAIDLVTPSLAALFAPMGIAAYYLIWKHVVAFLNAEMGIA